MPIRLHKNARTTPAVRQAIQASTLSERALAQKHGISRTTVRKWKHRSSVEDASHRPHTLRTTLTPAQEAIVVYLRQALLLPLDDLLAVTREFLNPAVSRSGLDRCLRRHGVASLKTLLPPTEKAKVKPFKAYEPGFLHLDVKYLPAIDGEPRRYLFVAIDRATRWVYVALKPNRSALSAKDFLKAVIQAAPFRIQKCLTDNGSEFTDRFLTRTRQPSGTHEFDRLCTEQGIEHRLIPPGRPQTNGLVERFNGRIEEVLQTHHFDSTADLDTTLHRYVELYNHHIPQKALGHLTPIQALKNWQLSHPHLFRKKVYDLAGLDSYQAFRWTQTTGLTGLGGLDANDGFTRASGISADGSIIVGYSRTSAHPLGSGYRWTESTGMADLGQLPGDVWSWAQAISADSSVIVGISNTLTDQQAFRWTAEDGMISLGNAPAATSSGASAVSEEGTVIAGQGKIGDFNYAMVWTEEGGWKNFGTLPGYQNSNTNAISGDGTVVGQSFNFDSATSTFTSEGFIWDEANGMRNVKEWLMDEYGLDLAAWTISNVLGISGDGRFIAGYGINPDGNTEDWLADLSPSPVPLPAAFWLLASGLVTFVGAARNGCRVV